MCTVNSLGTLVTRTSRRGENTRIDTAAHAIYPSRALLGLGR